MKIYSFFQNGLSGEKVRYIAETTTLNTLLKRDSSPKSVCQCMNLKKNEWKTNQNLMNEMSAKCKQKKLSIDLAENQSCYKARSKLTINLRLSHENKLQIGEKQVVEIDLNPRQICPNF